MGYFLASIISISAALVIMLTRYTADNTTAQKEIEYLKESIIIIDNYVNTYIESGGVMEKLNIKTLDDDKILLSESKVTEVDTNDSNNTTLSFHNHEDIIFMIIPNHVDSSAYDLFIDFSKNKALMSKSKFVENLIKREYCEKSLYGDFNEKYNSYNSTDKKFNESGTKDDGLVGCIVYK